MRRREKKNGGSLVLRCNGQERRIEGVVRQRRQLKKDLNRFYRHSCSSKRTARRRRLKLAFYDIDLYRALASAQGCDRVDICQVDIYHNAVYMVGYQVHYRSIFSNDTIIDSAPLYLCYQDPNREIVGGTRRSSIVLEESEVITNIETHEQNQQLTGIVVSTSLGREVPLGAIITVAAADETGGDDDDDEEDGEEEDDDAATTEKLARKRPRPQRILALFGGGPAEPSSSSLGITTLHSLGFLVELHSNWEALKPLLLLHALVRHGRARIRKQPRQHRVNQRSLLNKLRRRRRRQGVTSAPSTRSESSDENDEQFRDCVITLMAGAVPVDVFQHVLSFLAPNPPARACVE